MKSKPAIGRILALGIAAALALGACGGSATPAPTAAAPGATAPTQAASTAPTAAASAAATSGAGASGDAIAAIANLESYKLKLVMAGKGVTSGMFAMGDVSISGTFVVKPAPASDVTASIGALKMRIVDVNGKTYTDLGGTLAESTSDSQSKMIDAVSPQALFGGFSPYLSQMKAVGDEQKNGVATTHLQAQPDLLAQMASSLSVLGIENGTWTADVWIAKDGGYAVSYVIAGTGSGQSMTLSLDLTDINSSSNVVKGP